MLKFAIPVAVLVSIPIPAYAQCESGYFPLVCNGPLDAEHAAALVTTSSTAVHEVMFDFIPGRTAAGERGGGLPPGTCSWIDRAFRRSEPARLRLFFDHRPAQTGAALEGVLTAIDTCNVTEACRFSICAQRRRGHMEANARRATIMHVR